MLGTLSKAPLPKEVREYIISVRRCVKALDAEMQRPAGPQRGSAISRINNALEFASDHLEHFGIKGYPAKRK